MNVLETLEHKGNSLGPPVENVKKYFGPAAVSCPMLFLIHLGRESFIPTPN